MKSKTTIHNLETLEKELYKQIAASKEASQKLKKDMDYLGDNFFVLAKNSVKKQRIKEETSSSFIEQLLGKDPVREVVNGITDRIANHTGKAVDMLIDKLFRKHS